MPKAVYRSGFGKHTELAKTFDSLAQIWGVQWPFSWIPFSFKTAVNVHM